MIQKFPYHLVDQSPWPIFSSFSLLTTTMGAVMYFHSYNIGGYVLTLGLISITISMLLWFKDVVREATFEGHHTFKVKNGIKMGMILFILSEVLFFFGFFWAFFHSSLVPSIALGSVWPPLGINALNAWDIPLLNSVILLSSGATITWAHHSIVAKDRKSALLSLYLTIVLAIIFTVLQGFEYFHAEFTIADGVYGSTFYMCTGFHGFHVIVGTLFILYQTVRLNNYHFTNHHHLGFESAAWYWHFVDVVWLFLFVTVYWWGGL
jgi:cytochrome c oxidase subunit 3